MWPINASNAERALPRAAGEGVGPGRFNRGRRGGDRGARGVKRGGIAAAGVREVPRTSGAQLAVRSLAGEIEVVGDAADNISRYFERFFCLPVLWEFGGKFTREKLR